jgi:hypothetical protein
VERRSAPRRAERSLDRLRSNTEFLGHPGCTAKGVDYNCGGSDSAASRARR